MKRSYLYRLVLALIVALLILVSQPSGTTRADTGSSTPLPPKVQGLVHTNGSTSGWGGGGG